MDPEMITQWAQAVYTLLKAVAMAGATVLVWTMAVAALFLAGAMLFDILRVWLGTEEDI